MPAAAFLDRLHSPVSRRAGSETELSDRFAALLDRIDCRRADTSEQREAIFRLRYQAYLRNERISRNSSVKFSDPYDETGDVHLFGLYIDDELASSIRIHVAAGADSRFPSLEVFYDHLQPKLDAGNVLIDSTRFVTDEKLARQYRLLPYATLRLCAMAAQHFGADYLLAAVRTEHQAFYRRIWRCQLVCEPRPYPLLTQPICLMMLHFPTVMDEERRRYPFFRSTFFERKMLFQRSPTRANFEQRANNLERAR